MHTLEPYLEKTNLVSLGFYIVSQFFAIDTVLLSKEEILEGVSHVAHSWQENGGSISRTRWIYNELKPIKQVHHLLNEPLPLVIAFETNLNKDLVSKWAQQKGAKVESKVSASAVKDEENELADIVASPPRKGKALPVPKNASKKKLSNVLVPPMKKAKMEALTLRGVSKVSTFKDLAPSKASTQKQSASRQQKESVSQATTGPSKAPPKLTPSKASTGLKHKNPQTNDRETPSKAKVSKN
ncbi:unnamed protein product [Calypogeia fissa]